MRVIPQPAYDEDEEEVPDGPIDQLLHLDEHTPLLIGGPEAGRQDAEEALHGKQVKWTVTRFVKDWEGFWVFGMFLALCMGPVSSLVRKRFLYPQAKLRIGRNGYCVDRIFPHIFATGCHGYSHPSHTRTPRLTSFQSGPSYYLLASG